MSYKEDLSFSSSALLLKSKNGLRIVADVNFQNKVTK